MTHETSHSGFFLIIPAFVANCRDIDAETKLLYGRIVSLANQKGYCFASDQYLADLSGCEKRVIQDRLLDLEKMKFIRRHTKKNGVLWDRKIYPIFHEFSNKVYEEHGCATRDAHPCDSNGTNVPHTNISNTNIRKNTAAEEKTGAAKTASAADFLEKRKEKQKSEKIFDCLKNSDIPEEEKIWIVSRYSEEIVKNALEWVNDQPSFSKGFLQALKYACKNKKKNEMNKEPLSIYQLVCNIFKNGEKYNEAECFIDEKSITFQRGMNHKTLELNNFFSWDKLKKLCEHFGIKYDRVGLA